MSLSPAGVRRRPAPTAWAACALVLALAAGCTPSDAGPPPTGATAPSSGATVADRSTAGPSAARTLPTELDLSADEEKAAREALRAFDEYLRVRDTVMQDGGKQPERLESVATSVLLEAERNGALRLETTGTRVRGGSTHDSDEIQKVTLKDDPPDLRPTVTFKTCVDVSGSDVVDRNGTTTLTGSRQLRWPSTYYIWFVHDQAKWLVGDLKQGEGTC